MSRTMRTVLATGAGLVLVVAGTSVASTLNRPEPTPTGTTSGPGELDTLRDSLSGLQGEVDTLEAAVAAVPTPAPASRGPVPEPSAPSSHDRFDDHGGDDDGRDDDGDDDRWDDHGGQRSDDHDDDQGYDDHGEVGDDD